MPKTDTLFVHGLKVEATIGVFAWEKKIKQQLLVDIEVETDVAKAAASDALEDAIDYDAMSKKVIELGEEHPYQLIETFAETVAEQLLLHMEIEHITLTVKKPTAVRAADTVGVRIARSKSTYSSSEE